MLQFDGELSEKNMFCFRERTRSAVDFRDHNILGFVLVPQEELEETVSTLLSAQKSWFSSVPILFQACMTFTYVTFLVVLATWVIYVCLDTDDTAMMAAMALLAVDAGEWLGDLDEILCDVLMVLFDGCAVVGT